MRCKTGFITIFTSKIYFLVPNTIVFVEKKMDPPCKSKYLSRHGIGYDSRMITAFSIGYSMHHLRFLFLLQVNTFCSGSSDLAR